MTEKVSPRLPEKVKHYLDHLSVERGASKNTIDSYRRDFESFFTSFQFLDSDSVSAYLSQMRKAGLSERTIARRISALRSLEAFLVRDDPSRTPWKVELANRGQRLPKSISYQSVRRLLESPGSDPAGLRDRAILEALYATGMRVSECVALDLAQVLDNGEGISFLRITGKGGKERLVPLGGYAKQAFDAYIVRSRSVLLRSPRQSALFLNMRGDRLTRQGIWQIIKKATYRAGLEEEITPHSLRHSFATHMIERGADIRSVQELLGHASVVTTQIYTMITQEILRETHAESHPRAR